MLEMLLAIGLILGSEFSQTTDCYCQKEEYEVLDVRGTIINLSQGGKSLDDIQILCGEDKLSFQDCPQAEATVVNTKSQQLFRISQKGMNADKDLKISSLLVPLSWRKERSVPTEVVTDMAGYFGDVFYVIGEELPLQMAPSLMDNTRSLIVLSYEYQGQPVRKSIGASGNIYQFSRDKIYGQIPPDSVSQLTLYVYNTQTKSAKMLHKFQLGFMEEERLEKIYERFTKNIASKQFETEVERQTYLLDFFFTILGNTDRQRLKAWLEDKGF